MAIGSFGLFRRNFGTVVFLLSADAVFLWTCVVALGDERFQLIDAYFIAQLQFKLLGLAVLCWAGASLLGSLVRIFLLNFRTFLISTSVKRRFFRMINPRFRIEVSFAATLLMLSLVRDPLEKLVYVFAALAAGGMGFYLQGIFSRGKPHRSSARALKKLSSSDDGEAGLKMALTSLRRESDRIFGELGLLVKALVVMLAILLGYLHVEKLKVPSDVKISLADLDLMGAVVGHTSYGLLVWGSDCDCLMVVGFGQLDSVILKD